MELDDLKEYLKNKKEEATGVDKSSEKLSLLLKSNPKSPVNKMTRNLIIEIAFALIITIALIYCVATINFWAVRTYLSLLLAVYCFGVIPYIGLYRKIKRLNNTVLPVKKNLEEIHDTMTGFIKQSIKFVLWITPVFFVVAATLGFYTGKTEKIPQIDKYISHIHLHLHNRFLIIALLVVYIVAITVGTLYFMRWAMIKLYKICYGKYLDELKEMLKYLEE